MKKRNYLVFTICILICGLFFMACTDDSGKINYKSVYVEGWTYELLRDDFPVQFAEGISTLFDYMESSTEYFQTYKLIDAYERGNPTTGRVELTTNSLGMTVPVMRDAIGYNSDLVWPANKETGNKIPRRFPIAKTVKGPDGTNVDVVHINGTLLQRGSENTDPNLWVQRTGHYDSTFSASSPETDFRFCASWPTISLYATPNETALKAFRDNGFGYTFWVKVNKDYMVYRTSIESWDYRVRESYEPKHYFGVVPGREPTLGVNYTLAKVGEWTKITVIYDRDHPGYNMEIAQWVMMYGIGGMYPGDTDPGNIDFNLQNTVRIIWDFSLPDNGGTEGGLAMENTISTGRHEFDIYIYDLQFLQYGD